MFCVTNICTLALLSNRLIMERWTFLTKMEQQWDAPNQPTPIKTNTHLLCTRWIHVSYLTPTQIVHHTPTTTCWTRDHSVRLLTNRHRSIDRTRDVVGCHGDMCTPSEPVSVLVVSTKKLGTLDRWKAVTIVDCNYVQYSVQYMFREREDEPIKMRKEWLQVCTTTTT